MYPLNFFLLIEMYSMLQMNTNYLSPSDEEISLPAETSEGETTLNDLQVIIIIHLYMLKVVN